MDSVSSFLVFLQCRWQEEECSEEEIIQQMTHMGLCYSFGVQEADTDPVLWKHSYSAGQGGFNTYTREDMLTIDIISLK